MDSRTGLEQKCQLGCYMEEFGPLNGNEPLGLLSCQQHHYHLHLHRVQLTGWHREHIYSDFFLVIKHLLGIQVSQIP